MNLKKLNVGLVSNSIVRKININKQDLRRLENFANFSWIEFNEQSSWDESPQTSKSNIQKLCNFNGPMARWSGIFGILVALPQV